MRRTARGVPAAKNRAGALECVAMEPKGTAMSASRQVAVSITGVVLFAVATACTPDAPPPAQSAEPSPDAIPTSTDAAASAEPEATPLEAGQAFLAENALRANVVTTASGLQYEVLASGDGAAPGPRDIVTTHYVGTFIDGRVFDSSIERGAPAAFPVDRVISGWTEGLQLMKVGDKWKLYVPAELAYGEQGTGGIGPNETLIFEVELLDVQRRG